MKKIFLFATLIIGLILLTSGLLWQRSRHTRAAPTVLVGTLQSGCYQITETACKLYIEPFTIEIAPAEELTAIRLQANEQTIYDFATTSGRAPTESYTPSEVKKDFAASCGQTYVLELHAMDTGDLDFVTIGETLPFTCPKARHRLYMPSVQK